MNLSQIRVAVRDKLMAGKGQNQDVTEDTFWSDNEINLDINRGQNKLWKMIRKANADYFIRVLASTDLPVRIMGQTYNPSILKWEAEKKWYTLPPDFVRMKLMTDLSASPIRVIFSDLAKGEFRYLMNRAASNNGGTGEFLADIIGLRTLAIRPIPQEARDFELVYERALPPLRDWSTGNVTVTNGSSVVTFSSGADIVNRVEPGDELIVGLAGSVLPVADPNAQYPMIQSIDSATQATLTASYLDVSVSNAAFIVSSVSHIPLMHHHLLMVYAVKEGFKKGPNPHTDAAGIWENTWDKEVPDLIEDVEMRHTDGDTVEPYLTEEYYDL